MNEFDWGMYAMYVVVVAAVAFIIYDWWGDTHGKDDIMSELPEDYEGPVYRCPHCNSDKVYFDAYAGMNDPDRIVLLDEKVCNACGERFTEAKECEK